MNCRPILLLGFLSLLLFSCQKELSFEGGKPAQGSLQDQSGECNPKTVSGNYTATLALGANNYLDVTVSVAQPGFYTISTDTVNGYYFRGTGNFNAAGTNSARLLAYGTPAVAGTDLFTVTFDSTSCTVPVTVLPNTGGSSGTAVYTLDGNPGTCTGILVVGSYTQGTAMNATNKIDVKVNVTTPGSWTLSTAAVNGVAFAGTGTFTTTGAQTISLPATGTPAASGNHLVTVQAASTSCSFTVTVAAGSGTGGGGGTGGGTGTTSTDYFPLTSGNWWSYNDGSGIDSIKTVVNGTGSYLSKTYQRLITSDDAGPFDTVFYRKDATTGFYYQYISAAELSSFLPMTFSQTGYEVLMLKNSLTTGATWNVDITGTVAGFSTVYRLQFTCVDANATISINGTNFTNVYHLTQKEQMGAGGVFSDIGTATDLYYAKGVGPVKMSDPTGSQDIMHWVAR